MKDIFLTIKEVAKNEGFKKVFFLPAESDDTSGDKTVNSCICLLIYAYNPFDKKTYVPAYYIASNKSYHSMKSVVKKLNEIGICAEEIFTYVKQLAVKNNIGKIGKNALLHINGFGSRIVLYTLKITDNNINACDLAEFAESQAEKTIDYCTNCTLCIDVCKTGAITKEGYIRERCIRNYMDNPPYPNWVGKQVETYLGCEKCMSVCPYNFNLPKDSVDSEYERILDPNEILLGNVTHAKKLLGSNVKTKRLLEDAGLILKNRPD